MVVHVIIRHQAKLLSPSFSQVNFIKFIKDDTPGLTDKPCTQIQLVQMHSFLVHNFTAFTLSQLNQLYLN